MFFFKKNKNYATIQCENNYLIIIRQKIGKCWTIVNVVFSYYDWNYEKNQIHRVKIRVSC